MNQFSEGAVGAIARALVKDRRDLSESLEFWRAHPAGRKRMVCDPLETISSELHENSAALVELAETSAPWLKQHHEWPLICKNLPTPRTSKKA